MRILVINMYSFPESFSSGYFVYELFQAVQENNHEVVFVTPNPVRGMSREKIRSYKDKKEETVRGIPHIRLWVNSNDGSSKIGRVLRILKYQRVLKKYLSENIAKFDLIYIPSNPPIFIPLMVEKMAKKHGVKCLYDVNDIFPDILNSKNPIMALLKKMAKKAFLNADYLVTLSEDMRTSLVAKGVDNNKINVFKIWPPTCGENEGGSKRTNPFGILQKDMFNVLYLGNIGQFQGCSLIVDIARYVKNPNILFTIIGGGREYNNIKREIDSAGLSNIRLFSRIPESEAILYYRAASLNLICVKKGVIFNQCPSKTSNCVDSDAPCLVLCDESLYSKEAEESFGFFVNSTYDPEKIAKDIERIYVAVTSNTYKKGKVEASGYEKELNLTKWENLIKRIEEEIRA